MRVPVVVLSPFALFALTAAAHADDSISTSTPRAPQPSLYGDEARLTPKGESTGIARTTFAATSNGAMRPFASDLARAGTVLETGAEVGVTSSLAFVASGMSNGFQGYDATASGASAAVRFAPLADGPVRVVASFGAMRDLGGFALAFSRLSLAADLGRWRLSGTTHVEHSFDPSRDAMDVMVTAGASYAATSALRVGAEYVAQDLEGAFDPTEKEGIRHFVGPVVGLAPSDRVWITAGPAVGLSYASPQMVGRLALVVAF